MRLPAEQDPENHAQKEAKAQVAGSELQHGLIAVH